MSIEMVSDPNRKENAHQCELLLHEILVNLSAFKLQIVVTGSASVLWERIRTCSKIILDHILF